MKREGLTRTHGNHVRLSRFGVETSPSQLQESIEMRLELEPGD